MAPLFFLRTIKSLELSQKDISGVRLSPTAANLLLLNGPTTFNRALQSAGWEIGRAKIYPID